MKRDLIKAILVMALALSMPTGAHAFATVQDPPPASDTEDKSEEKVDDLEPGKGKLSEFGETLAQFWSVSSAFQGTQSFDDNVFMANNFRKSDTVTKLSGRVTVAYRGQRTRFEASYLPEFSMYQRYGPLNYSTHNYSQSLTHSFSRRLEMHWNLNAYRAPSRGNLPFKLVNFGFFRYNMYSLDALQDGLNFLHGANTVGMSYRWTPRLKVTASVEGVATHFTVRGKPAVSPVSQELAYSAGAKVGIDYALNAAQSVGLTVGNTYFGALSPTRAIGTSDHQNHQSIRVTYNHRLRNKFSLHASAGPGITERPDGTGPQLSVFFDVGIARRLARSAYSVSFQRTSQVGLLQNSVTGYGGDGRIERALGRKWKANIGGSYLRSEGSNGVHQTESASGNGQISYRLAERITPYINYGYTHQKTLVAAPNLRNVNRNEIAIGFVYNFGVIAGR